MPANASFEVDYQAKRVYGYKKNLQNSAFCGVGKMLSNNKLGKYRNECGMNKYFIPHNFWHYCKIIKFFGVHNLFQ